MGAVGCRIDGGQEAKESCRKCRYLLTQPRPLSMEIPAESLGGNQPPSDQKEVGL
jgi:hypothetical protein